MAWDALVCSSTSLRTTVQAAIDEWEDVLRGRLGAADAQRYRLPRPQLPVIPFGTAVGAVESAASDAEARHTMRADLGIPDQAVMIYHLARLSPYDKAFPQPMLRAVQRRSSGAERGCTWCSPAGSRWRAGPASLRRGDRGLLPGRPGHNPGWQRPDVIRRCWAAADVFLLLSDTILETFGQA